MVMTGPLVQEALGQRRAQETCHIFSLQPERVEVFWLLRWSLISLVQTGFKFPVGQAGLEPAILLPPALKHLSHNHVLHLASEVLLEFLFCFLTSWVSLVFVKLDN